jgi:SAM-dependent methyltransferase
VLFTDARDLGLRAVSFDVAISGFMGWYDCFDFDRGEFTRPDTKAKGILRVLKDGGRLVCCSWDKQEDVTWMEEAVLRHYPAILENREYLERRPIGTAYENADGYELILRSAGFRDFETFTEEMTFVSSDEEEWWRQMRNVGWASLIDQIASAGTNELQRLKDAVFEDLQAFRHADGFRFTKAVFFVFGVK